jgi:hypothetical protein
LLSPFCSLFLLGFSAVQHVFICTSYPISGTLALAFTTTGVSGIAYITHYLPLLVWPNLLGRKGTEFELAVLRDCFGFWVLAGV